MVSDTNVLSRFHQLNAGGVWSVEESRFEIGSVIAMDLKYLILLADKLVRKGERCQDPLSTPMI